VYYDQQRPDDREKPPGCFDVLIITRAVFGVLLWPVLAMFAVILDLAATFYLYATHARLALIPIALTAAGIYGFTLWERHHYKSPPDA
jgi:polyferredoxin